MWYLKRKPQLIRLLIFLTIKFDHKWSSVLGQVTFILKNRMKTLKIDQTFHYDVYLVLSSSSEPRRRNIMSNRSIWYERLVPWTRRQHLCDSITMLKLIAHKPRKTPENNCFKRCRHLAVTAAAVAVMVGILRFGLNNIDINGDGLRVDRP